jgi:hypothetical protein
MWLVSSSGSSSTTACATAAACADTADHSCWLCCTFTLCRQYCARRLRSLYKALKFLHGKGRYSKKKLDVPQVTDARYAVQRRLQAVTAFCDDVVCVAAVISVFATGLSGAGCGWDHVGCSNRKTCIALLMELHLGFAAAPAVVAAALPPASAVEGIERQQQLVLVLGVAASAYCHVQPAAVRCIGCPGE